MSKKCEGIPGESYPGLFLSSKIDANRKCALTPDNPVEHSITVANASTLTFEIACRSICDKDYLEYVHNGSNPAESNVWSSSFSAPWRWDSGPRQTVDTARIQAKNGLQSRPDREVNVEINCKAQPYAAVGPFRILLQVDHEGD
jgi:hypothetical protein